MMNAVTNARRTDIAANGEGHCVEESKNRAAQPPVRHRQPRIATDGSIAALVRYAKRGERGGC